MPMPFPHGRARVSARRECSHGAHESESALVHCRCVRPVLRTTTKSPETELRRMSGEQVLPHFPENTAGEEETASGEYCKGPERQASWGRGHPGVTSALGPQHKQMLYSLLGHLVWFKRVVSVLKLFPCCSPVA